jgi:coenzyme F420 hydrogenase subunit beta
LYLGIKNQHQSNPYSDHPLVGTTLAIYEGHATDGELRFRGSSGGLLSALSLYCLEKEKMSFVLHTGMDSKTPWMNTTVQSKNRSDLLENAGSRYAPSSPCDCLGLIEKSENSCVFIGKPCDAIATSLLRKHRPELNEKLGLVLTFFCAGPPCTNGTLGLIRQMGINLGTVNSVRYRGDGWPGNFSVSYNKGENTKALTYKESWGALAKYPRAFRCQLCPDGLGEFADISCGDAWHRYKENGDPGRSLILVRSARGEEIVRKAAEAGYIEITRSDVSMIIAAQELPGRRKELFGRLLAMKILRVPTPNIAGYRLFGIWWENSALIKLKTILGTMRRILLRGLWHRNQFFRDT